MFGRRLNGLIAAAVLFGGCASTNNAGEGPAMAALSAERGSDGTLVERFDLTGDQKPNLWKVYRLEGDPEDPDNQRKVLIRKDIDLNNDGKVDIRRHLDQQGQLTKEEMDLDYDGHVDAIAHYKDGQIEKRELDLSLDGRPDVVKYYEEGSVVRKERDTDNNGSVDVWEYFEEGKLVRVGRDRDGDGKPELFDDAPEPEPELPGGASGG